MSDIMSTISEFYEGTTIFVTGGTGFMGKVLIEKLLTSCPGIEKIYLLIRHKKDEDTTQRLSRITESPVFEALKERHSERLQKLEALEGDMQLPGLGLSRDARAQLQRVHVVFNLAATLNFNEKLDKSIAVNVSATRTLLEMCLTMNELKSFVHVSTAYANCDRIHIEERVYPSPVDLEVLMTELGQCASEQELQELTTRVVGKRPNTYTLTKAMGESVVETYSSRIPVAIVRPSIVSAALRSPLPGWVDSRAGSTGIIVLIGTGLLRVAYGDSRSVIDTVPVDIAVNAVIVAAYRTAHVRAADPTVYNVACGRSNPLYLGEYVKIVTACCRQIPQETAKWEPSILFSTNRLLVSIARLWLHLVPAFLHDAIFASSTKMSMMQFHSKALKATEAFELFLTNTFDFVDDNFRSLSEQMSEQDRTTFFCDITEVQWEKYTESYVLGVRRYLLGQRDETLPDSKKQMRKYSIQNNGLKFVAAAGVAYYFALKFKNIYFNYRAKRDRALLW